MAGTAGRDVEYVVGLNHSALPVLVLVAMGGLARVAAFAAWEAEEARVLVREVE